MAGYSQKATHSVPQCVSPRPNWDPHAPPLPQGVFPPPPQNQRGRDPNSDDWSKSLALCLLCGVHLLFIICSLYLVFWPEEEIPEVVDEIPFPVPLIKEVWSNLRHYLTACELD